MSSSRTQFTNIDEYIANFPPEVQEILQKMRQTIHQAAPEATEAISYGIPTFKLNGNLVHFGGFTHHVSFFPASSGIQKFNAELSPYVSGKGTAQFPLDQPIPYDLITRIVLFRVQENQEKAAAKGRKKK